MYRCAIMFNCDYELILKNYNLTGKRYRFNIQHFQIVEGEEDMIKLFLQHIQDIKNVYNFVVVSFYPIKNKLFTDWSVKELDLNNSYDHKYIHLFFDVNDHIKNDLEDIVTINSDLSQ